MDLDRNETRLKPNDAVERHVAATIIFVISFTGLLANIMVVAFSQRLQSMRNSFGRLLTSQATGETVFCFIFAFYFSPTVFLNIDSMKRVSRHFGLVLLICYDICIFSHLFIALNRLCAICMPLHYSKVFSKSSTKVLMVVSWIVPLFLSCILYVYYDCGLIYEDSIYAFVWVPSEECKYISWNICFRKDVCIVSIIGVADITTIIKVHLTNTQIKKSGQRDTDQRRKKEINFLKQAVLQGIVFVFELYTYFILAWYFKDKWIIFALTSVTWTCTHCGDALIIITLNAEFRKLITAPKRFFRVHHYSSQVRSDMFQTLKDTRSYRSSQNRF